MQTLDGLLGPRAADKLNEADYDDIPDNPSVPVAMETAQVVQAMDAGTGRSSGEVNTPLFFFVETVHALQDGPQRPCAS